MEQPPTSPAPDPSEDSLESPSVSDEPVTPAPVSTSTAAPADGGVVAEPGSRPAPRKQFHLREFLRRFNIYLLLFVLLLVIGGVVVVLLYLKNRTASTLPKSDSTINSQNLSGDALKQLADSGVQVGDPKQVLNVQSNSVFAGTVLVRGQLQVAGGLKTSGDLALNGLNVNGPGSINRLQTQDLAVAGNGAFQGTLSVRGGLSAGSGSFSGGISAPQVTTNNLQLNGPLTLNNHLSAGGPTPGVSRGSAVGAGGSASINGSDTAGSISINSGSGTAAGCLVSVRFARAFSGTPHIVLTPVGSAGGSLQYYLTRTGGGFSICTNNAAPGGSAFGFDYVVFD